MQIQYNITDPFQMRFDGVQCNERWCQYLIVKINEQTFGVVSVHLPTACWKVKAQIIALAESSIIKKIIAFQMERDLPVSNDVAIIMAGDFNLSSKEEGDQRHLLRPVLCMRVCACV